MIGEVIQEYLVSLGVQIDKPGFQQMDRTIAESGKMVETVTGSWAANFVRASTIIGTAIASVTASVGGLMFSAAKADLEMDKYARNMMMTRDAAERMKRATDALGESINDIALSPELLGRFHALTADGSKMSVGGDFKETMKDLRDIMFEFTRLKQEASYAMTWIGYYLAKYLQKPLNEIREKFRAFNDSFVQNMSTWTEKIAKALVYVVNVGKHFLEFIYDVGKALYNLWDSFPRGVKIATAALAGFWAMLRMTPLGRMITLVSGLLLLIDDYYGYMEGKQAAFGKYWDRLNEFLERASELWERIKPHIVGATEAAEEFVETVGDSTGLKWLLDAMQDLGESFITLGGGIIDAVTGALEGFLDGIEKSDGAQQFAGLINRLGDGFETLYKWVVETIKAVGEWLSEMSRDADVRDFAAAVGECAGAVLGLFNAIWDLVGEALKALFEGFANTDSPLSFRDALKAVLNVVTRMTRWTNNLIDALTKVFRIMRDSDIVRNYWKTQGEAAKRFMEIIEKALKSVGKLGQALFALREGDWKAAKRIVGEVWDDLTGKNDKKQQAALGGGGGGSWGGGNKDIQHLANYASEYAQKLGFNIPPAFFSTIIRSEAGNDLSEHYQSREWNNPLGMDYSGWHKQFGGRPADEITTHGHTRTIFPSMEKAMEALVHYFTDDDAFDWAKEEIALIQQGKIWEAFKIHYDHYVGNGGSFEDSGYYSVIPEEFSRGNQEEKSQTVSAGSWDTQSIFRNPLLDVMDDVSIEGAKEKTIAMINYAGEIYKKLFPDFGELWVSAVTNGGHAPGSGHYEGLKADVGGDAFEIGGENGLTEAQAMRNRDIFTRALIDAGIGANDEYTYPSAGSTGGHFDLDSEGTVWNDSAYNGEYGGFTLENIEVTPPKPVTVPAPEVVAQAPEVIPPKPVSVPMPPVEVSGPEVTDAAFMQLSANVKTLAEIQQSVIGAQRRLASEIDGTPKGQQDFTQEVQSGVFTPLAKQEAPQPTERYGGILAEIKNVLLAIYEKIPISRKGENKPFSPPVISEQTESIDGKGIFDTMRDAIGQIQLPDLSGIGDKLGGALGNIPVLFSNGMGDMQAAMEGIVGSFDPSLLDDMFSGMPPSYTDASSGPVSIVSTVNVGGVTVQGGSGSSAQDIARSVGKEVQSRLDKTANRLYENMILRGGQLQAQQA